MTRLEPPKTKAVILPKKITLNIDGKKQDIPVGSIVEVQYKKSPTMFCVGYAVLCETGEQLPTSLLLSMEYYTEGCILPTYKVIPEDEIKIIKIHAE